MAITLDGTNGITTETGTGDVSVGDDLIFTGTGNRITGDFSNATFANRVAFQTNVANGGTTITAIPNGTSTVAQINLLSSSSDQDNTSLAQFVMSGTETRLNSGNIGTGTYLPMTFFTGGSERMRIDTSGNLLVARTTNSTNNSARIAISFTQNGITFTPTANDKFPCVFENSSGTTVGYIYTTSTATTYSTSSDYRLKENIAPMTGALGKVAQLNPVTYTWKSDGSDGQGFIAHELQAVIPEAVVGEKDAVDADGNPQYQGVDTSFLVATLTAAIQELSAKNDALEARIAALEGAQA